MDDILDVETGGMLEAWADLWPHRRAGAPGPRQRYEAPPAVRPAAGKPGRTHELAPPRIPERRAPPAPGRSPATTAGARSSRLTGTGRSRAAAPPRHRRADRGEMWSPPFEPAARLGDKNQEHCTVYNMMRLAEYTLALDRPALCRLLGAQPGERRAGAADPATGMIACYYRWSRCAEGLGHARTISGVATARWCRPTRSSDSIYYSGPSPEDGRPGITVAQYIPSSCDGINPGRRKARQVAPGGDHADPRPAGGRVHRPTRWRWRSHWRPRRPLISICGCASVVAGER